MPELDFDQSAVPSDVPPTSIGDITELDDGSERFLATVGFYTYAHCYPNLTPFYIGKGKGRRARDFKNRSQWHKNIVEKVGLKNVVIVSMSARSEKEAFLREKLAIASQRRVGVILCNLTDGGEGGAGVPLTGSRKAALLDGHKRYRENSSNMKAISEKFKGRTLSEAWKKKLSDAAKLRMEDPEQRKNLSEKCSGFKHSAEAVSKIQEASRRQASDPEIQKKKSLSLTGRKLSEETKHKIRAAHIARRKDMQQ